MTQWWALLNLLGLVCSFLGGLFLFYSLTLKPSNFRLVKVGEKELAICLDDKIVVAGYGGPLVVSDDVCPDILKTGPTPPNAVGGDLCKIVVGLLRNPALGTAAKDLRKANRHLRRDAALGVDQLRKSGACYTESQCGLRDRETERLYAFLENNAAGMRWILHGRQGGLSTAACQRPGRESGLGQRRGTRSV